MIFTQACKREAFIGTILGWDTNPGAGRNGQTAVLVVDYFLKCIATMSLRRCQDLGGAINTILDHLFGQAKDSTTALAVLHEANKNPILLKSKPPARELWQLPKSYAGPNPKPYSFVALNFQQRSPGFREDIQDRPRDLNLILETLMPPYMNYLRDMWLS
ncbi:hypothetical protein VNO77_27802 [Canavalia gladiata]|uniref:Uncharacterized protein n=1 Tax=Canavalia gladiata TaxID=3824 RepID=A0AAN9KVX5_CANGL